jgi:hypothetical protein
MPVPSPTKPHLVLGATGRAEAFTSPRGGGGDGPRIPARDRAAHAAGLLHDVDTVAQHEDHVLTEREHRGIDAQEGIIIEFDADPGFELALDSLQDQRRGVELLAVRDAPTMQATVFVPHGQLQWLTRRIEEYRDKETKNLRPLHEPLVARIAAIRAAALRSFWTDDQAEFPGPGTTIWWEVWLRAGANRAAVRDSFVLHATRMGLTVKAESLELLDRTVMLARGTPEAMAQSVELLDCFAELRRAKELAGDFLEIPAGEQAAWGDSLQHRLEPPSADSPAVCLLDSGLNAHPLLDGAVWLRDTVMARSLGVDDEHGHGTEMAGIALFGQSLPDVLAATGPVQLQHGLESIKVGPNPPPTDPELYGLLTAQAAYTAEASAPDRRRSFSLAITALDSRDRGKPSSWSSAIDSLTSAATEKPDLARVVFIAAGNVDDWRRGAYPDANHIDGVHDPGQAWNAVTVGAYTRRTRIAPGRWAGWRPIAQDGGLAPTSTTSLVFAKHWPTKPDIVMEGGNCAIDDDGNVDTPDDLRLLTTHRRPMQRWFTTTGDTSAATAQAARLGALIQSKYPTLWPETVRGLVVHSAEWTPRMLADAASNKVQLLRCFGHGVPDAGRAMWSASNALTLIVEDELQPFVKKKGQSTPTANEMHLHELPWPQSALEALGALDVELRVTLSYYVEPNPGRRGRASRHVYPSCRLRFQVRRPTETLDAFRARVNKQARDEETGSVSKGSDSDGWSIGYNLRHLGSIHQDTWQGSAANLANRGALAVFPATGWWKTSTGQNRFHSRLRYALIVSIRTSRTDVDIYTPVLTQVGLPITIT